MLRRRRRPLLRPLPQTTFLRLHGAMASHPVPDPPLPAHRDLHPANDTPAGHALLDETPGREAAAAAAAYAATVGAHLRRGDLLRAEALFRAAPASARDAHLNAVMLDGYAKAGRLEHARKLFDGMTTKDVWAWTTLVSGYCRAGRVDEARALFDKIPDRNVVSWTAMVQGYAHAGMLKEAREMFDAMPERNLVTWTVMVKAYADGGHIREALGIFHRMPRRSSYAWNAMFSGLLRAGRVDEAVRLFDRMQHKTVVSWTVMVTGLAQNGRILMAREFFDTMPGNKDIMAWNAMITAYANGGQMSEARKLFDSMPAKDLVSWGIVIDGYAKNELKDEAVGLFLLMLRSAVSPDSTTLTSILVTSESTDEVGQVHGLATKIGLLSETFLGNALLTMYSRSGDLHSAWQAFKMLEEKDAITWTSMMQAFVNHGHAFLALQAFAQMLRHGHNPSSTTFTAALSACRHAGLVEKGQHIFRSIRSVYGLMPTVEHRDIVGRTVRAREVTEVVMHDQEMELKERERRRNLWSQLTMKEPAGAASAAIKPLEDVAAMPPETRGQEMELKERERRRNLWSRLTIKEPAGAATAAIKEPVEDVAAMPPEMRGQEMELKERKSKSKEKSVKDSRLAIEVPAGVEAAAAATECTPTIAATKSTQTKVVAATECTPTKAATTSVSKESKCF